jgi:MoaA/NifB/PqqE/SkfB family radical SAM enzyme
MLTHVVTFSCNARCIMCDSWRKSAKGDLELAEIETIYRALPELDAVRLTGGEPFVRKDLPRIAELVEQHLRPLLLHITTNGFLTDRIVSFVEQRDKKTPLQLLVSLDGFGSKHDQVRGRPNAWKRTLATLEALAPRQKELGLSLAVNQTVVDADGVEQFAKLAPMLRQMTVRHQLVVAYAESATYSVQTEREVPPEHDGHYQLFGELSPDTASRLLRVANHSLCDYPIAERMVKGYYLTGLGNRLLNDIGRPKPKCVALGAHMRLLPNGDVPTCQFNTRAVGNLRDDPFSTVWSGAAAAVQRDWVAKCPGCWAECEVVPNALYSGDLFRWAAMALRGSTTKA